jgi:hypothetical protein
MPTQRNTQYKRVRMHSPAYVTPKHFWTGTSRKSDFCYSPGLTCDQPSSSPAASQPGMIYFWIETELGTVASCSHTNTSLASSRDHTRHHMLLFQDRSLITRARQQVFSVWIRTSRLQNNQACRSFSTTFRTMLNHTGTSPTESCLCPFILAVHCGWEVWGVCRQPNTWRFNDHDQFGAPLPAHTFNPKSKNYQL